MQSPRHINSWIIHTLAIQFLLHALALSAIFREIQYQYAHAHLCVCVYIYIYLWDSNVKWQPMDRILKTCKDKWCAFLDTMIIKSPDCQLANHWMTVSRNPINSPIHDTELIIAAENTWLLHKLMDGLIIFVLQKIKLTHNSCLSTEHHS
jgi:hypothetical protein